MSKAETAPLPCLRASGWRAGVYSEVRVRRIAAGKPPENDFHRKKSYLRMDTTKKDKCLRGMSRNEKISGFAAMK